jgi:hypothetical protein
MKQKHYSVTPYWDVRAMNETSKLSRIMITVHIHGIRPFKITLKLKSNKVDFDKAVSGTSRFLSEEAKEVRKELNDYLLKADTILERLDNPSQEIFTRLFKSETDLFVNNKTSIVPFFEYKISKLFSEERFSYSFNYKLSLKSFHKYKSPLNFEDIDLAFLKGYVSYMLQKGNSVTTAQIYLRNLRVIYNQVINEESSCQILSIQRICFWVKGEIKSCSLSWTIENAVGL